MPERTIDYLPVDDLVAAPRNPKRHAEADLAVSLSKHGYTEPVLLDERTGKLVAGHGRVEALLAAQNRGGGTTRRGDRPRRQVDDPRG